MNMKKNVYIFYVLAFLQGLVFYSSIATLYRTSHNLSLYEMGIIDSCFYIFVIVFEIPWGMLCDRIGYKKTMLIANTFYFVSKIVFWKANGFGMFLLERLLLALAVSGLSGCDMSLLYLSTDKEKSTEVFGKNSMFGVIGMVVASLMFTFVFKSNMELAAFATIFPFVLNFILTFFLQDYPVDKQEKMEFKSIFKFFRNNKTMIYVLMASVLLTETAHTLTIFYNQLQYERVNIPIAYYGIIFVGLQLLGTTSGLLGKLTEKYSKEKIASTLFLMGAVCSLGLYFSNDIVSTIVYLMILTCANVMYVPILSTIENENVKESNRATILSFYSLTMSIGSIIMSYVFGVVVSHSLLSVYLMSCICCLLGFVLFSLWKRGTNY